MDFCRKEVLSDCDELLRRFQQTQSVRFEGFSNIWREMKFSHIFYGTSNAESRRFSRLILDLASTFFLPPHSFQIRVGGLYLLYSLYFSQSASPPQQIRVALKDWEEVRMFERDALEAQHTDVVFVLHKLESCKAFHHTAMPLVMTFQRKKKERKRRFHSEFMERTARPQELINMELLEEMSNVHKLYQKLKTSVVPASSDSFSLVREDLVPRLQDTVVNFYCWQQETDVVDEDQKDQEDQDKQDSGEGTSSQESGRRAELLASIKSRAYGEAAQASKSRRHRQVEVDFSSQGAGPSDAKPRARKFSLKARVGHILGELDPPHINSTSITRLSVLDSYRKRVQTKRFSWK